MLSNLRKPGAPRPSPVLGSYLPAYPLRLPAPKNRDATAPTMMSGTSTEGMLKVDQVEK